MLRPPLPQPGGGFLCPVQLIAPKEFHEPFMIDIFESTAQLRPEAVFFTAVDRRGNETAYHLSPDAAHRLPARATAAG